MIQGLIGKKIGMTQVFDEDGTVVPVTVIKTGPCVVVQKRKYGNKTSVQVGLVEDHKVKNVNRPMMGHFKKADVPPVRKLKEFQALDEGVKVGDILKIDIFKTSEKIRVIGRSKGKGFQGVVKRWNFSGGKKTHGSKHSRRTGSIGMCAYPGRVIKGKKMPGRTGGKTVNLRGLEIKALDMENNCLLVKGAVPGARNSYVYVLKDSLARS